VVAGGDMAQIAPGHTYEEVDDILSTYLRHGDNEQEMKRLNEAYGAETVERVLIRHRKSDFKRKRMPLVIERSLYDTE
jgi:NH3-dependent NAD+ synthetase